MCVVFQGVLEKYAWQYGWTLVAEFAVIPRRELQRHPLRPQLHL